MRKVMLFLCLAVLVIALSGIVAADDQTAGSETYGAYPGAPTSVPTSPEATIYPSQATSLAQTSAVIPAAYPSQPTSVIQPTAMQTVTPGAVAAYPSMISGTSAATAVYYTQAPPVAQQNVLLSYNVQSAPPAAVYYSGSYLPWTSFYQVFPANSPALWIASSLGWSWYATCPVGGWVQELIYVPVTGTMKVYDLNPDGTTQYYSYGFVSPGYNLRWFHMNTPGRYMTMITVSDIPSNYIIVDAA